MKLYDELYFEIKAFGTKSEIDNFINYLNSGELDDFFEFSESFIDYDDEYETASPNEEVSVHISNDDYGVEIDEFNVDDFLETICKAGKRVYLKGQLFDADNDEYNFVSNEGDSYYINALLIENFNQDEDRPVEDDDDDEIEEWSARINKQPKAVSLEEQLFVLEKY